MKIDYDNKNWWISPEDDVDEKRLDNLFKVHGRLVVLSGLKEDSKWVQITLREE